MNEQPLLNKSSYGPANWPLPDADGRHVTIGRETAQKGSSLNRMSASGNPASSSLTYALRMAYVVLTLLLSRLSPVQAQSSTIDLSLRSTVSRQNPAIGDVLIYTVVVANTPGSTTATGVVVIDKLQTEGVTYVPGSATVVRGSGSYTSATGVWNVGSVAPGDSGILVLKGTVLKQGVWFSTAEVTAADQTDADSKPDNQSLNEDDYDAICFSVPILWYPGDEYTVSVPSGYDQLIWYRNDEPITTSTVSASLAVVNEDRSLTFKSLGTYRFVTYRDGCPATNCCNIEVISGSYSSLGDKVFIDADKNGIQGDNATKPGLSGVVVVLLDGNLSPLISTTTNAGGLYSFTGLTPGIPYSVSFVTPTGYVSASANAGGNDALDSDADPLTGRTTQTYSLTAGQNNTSVDAGYYLPASVVYDVAIAKNVQSTGPYLPGSQVIYTLTVKNNSSAPVYNVRVDDLLPSGSSLITANYPVGINPGSGPANWVITGPLAVQATVVLTLTTQISSTYAAASVTNTAVISRFTATADANDPAAVDSNPASNTATVGVPVGTTTTPPCDTKPPFITCAIKEICKGGSTTMKATGCEGGTVKWSDGQSGSTVDVSPTVTTTYLATCVLNGCVSGVSNPISITVLDPQTPVITALPAGNFCPGTSLTLTAAGCEGGTIVWSENRRTGTSIVVAPTGKTTYTAQCRLRSCLSNPATKTIDVTTGLPTPTITCSTTVVCPGETVTLAVNGCVGTPVWSSTTQTTGNIIVTPTTSNNAYSVYCTNGTCTSKSSPVYSISMVTSVILAVRASADSVCAKGLVSLTATGCNGTVIWNATDKNGASLTGAVINVYPETSISYYAQCRFRICLSDPSNAVPITVVAPSTPIIKSDKSLICSGEPVTLTAEGCAGTVKWYGVDKVGASIGIFPAESKEYYAICKQGACESDPSNKVRVTVNTTGTAPSIAASTTSMCSGGIVSLTATGCAGSVIWSDGQAGSVVSVTATPTNREFYAICKSGATCGSGKSNVIKIEVGAVITPTVTCSTTVICPGENVTLTVNNCQGTPVWNTNETTTNIIVSPAVTTAYTVYCQSGVCRSATSLNCTITVIPVPAPTILASATSVEPGGTVSLSATGCPGEVIWSANDVKGNNKGAVIIVRPEGIQAYYAQCKFRLCLSDPSGTIVLNTGPCSTLAGTLTPVSATVTTAITDKTVTVAATTGKPSVQPSGYSVLYVLTKGTGLIVQQTSTKPTFTVPGATATYTIHTLVYNADSNSGNYLDLSVIKPGITTAADLINLIASKKVCANLDVAGAKITVKFAGDATNTEPPVLTVSSQTVCAGTKVTFAAAGCAGGIVRWSDGSTGQTLDKIISGDLRLTATCTLNGVTSGSSTGVSVIVGSPGVPTIVSNRSTTVCANESVTLTATGCAGGTYSWSDGKTTNNTLTVLPTAMVSYRVKCAVGSCESGWSAFTTISVGTPNAPTITMAGSGTAAVSSTTVCFGGPVTLTAQGCPANSSVTWSNDLVGTSITVSLATSGTYTARCLTSTNCRSAASNPIAITVLPRPAQPLTIDRTNACPATTIDLASGVTTKLSTTGGVFEYYTSATLSSESKVAGPAAVRGGTYYVVEKTVNGCYSLPALIHVMITVCGEVLPCDPANPGTASAGTDASICAAKSYQLSGSIGGAGKIAHWSTTGSGTFDNPFIANAVYTASAGDVVAGKVTLTLSVSTNNATCSVAKDDMLLTIEGSGVIPTVTVVGTTNFCSGDSVTLQAPAGASYLWSTKAKTGRIVVRTSGVYSVQLINAKGCSSVKSADVFVTVSEPVPTPLVANLRNTCPAIVANLSRVLSNTVTGTTYEYRIGPSALSQLVTRPDSVGAGTYYVFGRSKGGCLSAPANVTVSIVNCAADSLTTDLSITKTVSKTSVNVGDIITYTVKIRNIGTHTATNIDVRDVLPSGLELVLAPVVSYSVANGTITKRIASLAGGKSDSIVFAARVTAKGVITNRADITYLDQRDTNIANNRSQVTVRDTANGKPSLIGLAKSVMGTIALGDSLIKVSYRFVLTNFGTDTLRKVQVVDDLAYFFSPNAVVAAVVTPKTAGSTLELNPAFTGKGNNTVLFDSASYMVPGRSQVFTLDVTVKRAAGDTTKSFRNIANVTAQNSVTAVYDLSADGSDADPDGDGNPTNNTSFSSFILGAAQVAGPRIGLALAVVRVEKRTDGSYDVTYKATVKNTGDVPLFGITLTDSLIRAFAAPASYSVVGPPVVAAGSGLVANAGFNGNTKPDLLTNTSQLAVGEQATVSVTVNVRLNGVNGPFLSTALVTGRTADSGRIVRDISNNGVDPTVAGAVPTAVRFDLPSALLGVAKSVGTPVLVEEGVYDIPYTITLSNMGSMALKKVQVIDNLSETFKNGALIVSNRLVVKKTGTGLTVDSLYTGQGLITKLLIDAKSNLPVGASNSLQFVVRVNVKNANSLTFYNTALATALTDGNEPVEDRSTAGIDNDPDNDLDPRNNSVPTPVSLNRPSANIHIGVAMAVRDTVRQVDGSYNVTYQIVLKNYSRNPLKNVSLTDSLSKVFNAATGATYAIVKAPFTTSTGSALKLNPNYNGATDARIVLGDSISVLAAGKMDTILVTLNIRTDGSTTTFLNSAYAQAKAGTVTVSDVSTNGLNPDLNGNNNPTDPNEREATPLTLPPTSLEVFIPQGFSPNSDGINDLFVIRGMGSQTVSLEVYNRWGHMVYKNDDYRNDWDGKANTGIMAGPDAGGLPDATYYYVIRTSDGRKFVRYMTINR